MELDEILYAAITSDETLMTLTGGRVKSTSFEVAPNEKFNTPIPYIVIYEEPGQNDQGTKDTVWENSVDLVNVAIEFAGISPNEVKRLRRLIRKAIGSYVTGNETDIIELKSLSYDGIQWFWEKPCYYDTLHYSCDMAINLNDTEDNEQEE